MSEQENTPNPPTPAPVGHRHSPAPWRWMDAGHSVSSATDTVERLCDAEGRPLAATCGEGE